MGKKIASLALALLMLSSLTTSALADTQSATNGDTNVPVTLQAEAATFSVTVPTSLPLTLKSDGTVVTAAESECKITNNSSGPVEVKNVEINSVGSWTKVDYSTEFKDMPLNAKKFAMTLNDVESDITSTFSVISPSASTNFSYAAKVAMQSEAITTDTTIATVVFTIGWNTDALAALQSELKTKSVGDTVTLSYTGVDTEFIIVQKGNPAPDIYDESCDGTWLLSKNCIEDSVAWDTAGGNDYANSSINKHLAELASNFDFTVPTVKIPYWAGTGTSGELKTGSDGLSVQLFLLSTTEVGSSNTNDPITGAKLDYFTTDNSSRIANGAAGTVAMFWWLRSPLSDDDTHAFRVGYTGSMNYYSTTGILNLRVAMIIPY